tara:strand:+ start:7893 stop:8087 length:195 start_codon:yes stop_codon:yes gene_type:complete
MKRLQKILLGVLAITAFAWVSNASYEEAVQAENHYCKMVAIYESSDGEMGWPNFKQLDCNGELR